MATSSGVQDLGKFNGVGVQTHAFGTAIAILVQPYGMVGTASLPGSPTGPMPALNGVPHINHIIVDAGGHGNALTILRPLNRVKVTANALASATSLSINGDPGLYATNFNYPLADGSTAPRTGNSAIQSGDYIVYQAADGTWVLDTAQSAYTAGAITVTALPTGGVSVKSILYFMGQTGYTDPNTGALQPTFPIPASAARVEYSDTGGLWSGLHPGDPLVVFNPNATTADTLSLVRGFYGQR